MPRPSWSGTLTLMGFPVRVAAWRTTKSPSRTGFKMLDPNKLMPVQQVLVDVDGNRVAYDEARRGVAVYDGIMPLEPAQVEALTDAERTRVIEGRHFPLRATVPLHLATGHYQLGPPEKEPEAGDSLNVLWNGLRASKRALVTEWVKRAGSRAALVAITADEDGLFAHELPYWSSLQEATPWMPEVDKRQAEVFKQMVLGDAAALKDFHHELVEDHYDLKREAMINAALAGEKVAFEGIKPPEDPSPDLMAALEAQMADTPKPAKSPRPKPKAKTTRKKARA